MVKLRTGEDEAQAAENAVRKEEFTIVTQDDYLRVDNLCRGLLLAFYHHLQAQGLSPEEATCLANGADYYVRDFLVDRLGANLFDEKPGAVKRFGGNWYIVSNVEPDIDLLAGHLAGVRAFYRYLWERGLISEAFMRAMEEECSLVDYFRVRIDSFWEIEGGGFDAWERECTIREFPAAKGRA